MWDALTNAERIPRWFLPVTGDLKLGGRYQLQGQCRRHDQACEPPRHLAVTWEFGGGVSWVTVRLSPDPKGGTRLELEHAAHVEEHWKKFGPGAVGIGWDLGLLGLARHLETGEAVKLEGGRGLGAVGRGQELHAAERRGLVPRGHRLRRGPEGCNGFGRADDRLLHR